MEQNHITGKTSLMVWLVSTTIAWVNSPAFGEFLKDASLFVSILAGVLTARYYFFEEQRKRKNKKNK